MTKKPAFSKEIFQNKIYDYTRMVSGKNLDEASETEVYQSVAFAIKDILLDEWIATQKKYEKDDVKMLYYLSWNFCRDAC
jgi:starch phosphorylase